MLVAFMKSMFAFEVLKDDQHEPVMKVGDLHTFFAAAVNLYIFV